MQNPTNAKALQCMHGSRGSGAGAAAITSSSEQPQGNHPRLYDGAHFPDVLSRDRFNVLPIALITPT